MSDMKLGGKPQDNKAPANANAKKPAKKGMNPALLLMGGFGAFLLIIIIAVIYALSSKKPAQPKPALQQEQAQQQTQAGQGQPQDPSQSQTASELQEALSTHRLNAQMVQKLQGFAQQNYWLIAQKDPAGQDIDPLKLFANQLMEQQLRSDPAFSQNPIGLFFGNPDEKGQRPLVALDGNNPQAQNIYLAGVDALQLALNNRLAVRFDEIVNENAQSKIKVVIVTDKTGEVATLANTSQDNASVRLGEEAPAGGDTTHLNQVSNLDQLTLIENWAIQQAVAQYVQTKQQLQTLVPAPTQPEPEPEPEISYLEADNLKLNDTVNRLTNELAEARRDAEASQREANEAIKAKDQIAKQAQRVFSELEKNATVNKNLNQIAIHKVAPHLQVVATFGDTMYLQDDKGVSYTLRTGDVMKLPNGKALILTNAQQRLVTVY